MVTPSRTLIASVLTTLAVALPAHAQPLPSRAALTELFRIEAVPQFALCHLPGPPIDVDLNGPTVNFSGPAYSDADLACIADVSLEQGWEVMFPTVDLYNRYSAIEMQRPYMQRSVAE